MSRCKSCNIPMDHPAVNPISREPEDICNRCIERSRETRDVKFYQWEHAYDGVTSAKGTLDK